MQTKQLTKKLYRKSSVTCIGILGILVIFMVSCANKDKSIDIDKMPVVFQTDFEDNNLDGWHPTDVNAWRIESVNDNQVLSLFSESEYDPPVSSPKCVNWIKDLVVGDFCMDELHTS